MSARSATTGLPEMSLPTTKVSGPEFFFHSGVSITPRSETDSERTFGTSTPMSWVPGIGASIRTVVAESL